MTSARESVLAFVKAVEARAPIEQIAEMLHEDLVQHELPNKLFPKGAVRGKAELLAANEKGRTVMSAERYDVKSAVETDGRVALEIDWSGTLSVAYGELPVGHVMRASLAMFVDVRDGRIVGMRNYDCYA